MTDGLRLDVTLSPSKEATVTVAGKKTAAVSEEERVDAITVALWDVSARAPRKRSFLSARAH